MIVASHYQQSCNVDSDCISATGKYVVQFGNWCGPECFCGGDAINQAAAAKYDQDVAKTPIGSGAVQPLGCGCAAFPGVCCISGTCNSGSPCLTVDAGH
jgi:hypothetical protein